ncbi:uncharacterized protein LOC116598261 isoform X3 [Mustela erminea]|uniref:uncharacterized protein LOC116598261 isoform X3 n=1 Tax=Mustela erminea TaxID=36723 RepID=UPI001387277F|nr:uncharacterized protein LOC116598261 isoform X3 [Mustela erminea]
MPRPTHPSLFPVRLPPGEPMIRPAAGRAPPVGLAFRRLDAQGPLPSTPGLPLEGFPTLIKAGFCAPWWSYMEKFFQTPQGSIFPG